MTAENFTDYATTLLNGAITSTTATSFSVTGGQGSLFPSSNFVVSIDSELFFITSRSGDTFTVGTRGFNRTVATTHSNGVTVVLPVCSYNLQHLWQNVADTYLPVVPPVQLSGTASAYDNEFEAPGSWTLYPSATGGTVFNAGFTLKSHLLLSRSSGDNSLYTAYFAFVPGTNPWTATCKLSEGASLLTQNQDQAQTSFFVSDLPNPTNGADTGNRVKLNTVCANTSAHLVRTVQDTSGAASFVGYQAGVPTSGSLYLRLTCNGAGSYQTLYSSDGITYWLLTSSISASFTTASLGIAFHVYAPTNNWVPQTAAVDYVRVVYGSVLSSYGG